MTHGLPPTMKAVRLHSPGGIEGLVYEDVATPSPAAGEALVEVSAAALTRDELTWPLDRLPAIVSYELSGTVAAVAGPAEELAPGQAVYALTGFDRDGVAADYAVVPVAQLAPKPQTLSHVESAAVPLAALSAVQGLFDHGRLEADQRVMIHGAAGGVGAFAVQLARLRGAHVIATASGERVARARDLGAHEVIDVGVTDFTAADPVDLVFDTGGGDRLVRSVAVVAPGGRLVSVAEEPPAEACDAAGVQGIFFIVEPSRRQLDELTGLLDQGSLRVPVDRTYSLADARAAFERSLDRSGHGKVVLAVAHEG